MRLAAAASFGERLYLSVNVFVEDREAQARANLNDHLSGTAELTAQDAAQPPNVPLGGQAKITAPQPSRPHCRLPNIVQQFRDARFDVSIRKALW